jgi:hypothetical protein
MMRRLRDLSPVATPGEIKRAMQVSTQMYFASAEELDDWLYGRIVIERNERAALVARMMSDA